MNKVILIGNLGADPELRHLESGHTKCSMNLATNRTWKDKDGQKQEEVTWHRITVWGAQAETAAQYLSKGRGVAIEGRIRNFSIEDAETGEKKYFTEIVADRVEFLPKGGQGNGNGQAQQDPADDEPPPF